MFRDPGQLNLLCKNAIFKGRPGNLWDGTPRAGPKKQNERDAGQKSKCKEINAQKAKMQKSKAQKAKMKGAEMQAQNAKM